MDHHNPSPSPDRRASFRWIFGTVLLTLLLLCLFAAPTVYIDPLFHYHAPLEQYQYPIHDERYQNDGITRHFDYDGIITGTSMTENFKTSEANELFDATFIKVPYSGARYKEINDNLIQSYESGHALRYIIRALDEASLIRDKDAYREDYDYPFYLYNDNLFDDTNYVLNKTILFDYTLSVPRYTASNNKTTPFDEYANWNASCAFGAEAVLSDAALRGMNFHTPVQQTSLTDSDVITIKQNLQQNVISLAQEHPETTFYLFLPPYSIVYWADLYSQGLLNRAIDAEQCAIGLLLDVPNTRLYSFNNNFSLICDLDNYKDHLHYGEWVNSWILEQFQSDEYLLTQDNYQDYLAEIRQFYTTFDYTSLNPTG